VKKDQVDDDTDLAAAGLEFYYGICANSGLSQDSATLRTALYNVWSLACPMKEVSDIPIYKVFRRKDELIHQLEEQQCPSLQELISICSSLKNLVKHPKGKSILEAKSKEITQVLEEIYSRAKKNQEFQINDMILTKVNELLEEAATKLDPLINYGSPIWIISYLDLEKERFYLPGLLKVSEALVNSIHKFMATSLNDEKFYSSEDKEAIEDNFRIAKQSYLRLSKSARADAFLNVSLEIKCILLKLYQILSIYLCNLYDQKHSKSVESKPSSSSLTERGISKRETWNYFVNKILDTLFDLDKLKKLNALKINWKRIEYFRETFHQISINLEQKPEYIKQITHKNVAVGDLILEFNSGINFKIPLYNENHPVYHRKDIQPKTREILKGIFALQLLYLSRKQKKFLADCRLDIHHSEKVSIAFLLENARVLVQEVCKRDEFEEKKPQIKVLKRIGLNLFTFRDFCATCELVFFGIIYEDIFAVLSEYVPHLRKVPLPKPTIHKSISFAMDKRKREANETNANLLIDEELKHLDSYSFFRDSIIYHTNLCKDSNPKRTYFVSTPSSEIEFIAYENQIAPNELKVATRLNNDYI